jgi:ABC-2 type transport system ATP-binding protein
VVLSASQLTKRFGPRTAVENVSFEVAPGEIVALLGPNGAGKTTTLRMLGGLINATRGFAAVDGVRLTRRSSSALRGRIGFLTESPGLWDRLTVIENMAVYARLYQLAEPAAVIGVLIDRLGLADSRGSRAAELSKGTRQKVALARALLHNPAILLLDEPTANLDPETTRSVRELLLERRAAGCAILVSTHNLDEAERLADRVAVLHQRLLALDTASALRQRLMTGRVIVRIRGGAAPYVDRVRAIDRTVSADGDVLTLGGSGEETIPALVRILVSAGADLLEVRAEMPALEDAYVHLIRQ